MGFKSIPPTVFSNWFEFPADLWRWPNFTPKEMACKGDGSLLIHGPSMDALQRLRKRLDAPLIIHSAYRDREYNARVGGAAGSMHLAARAFDVAMKGHDPHEFEAMARGLGFAGFGFYPEKNFMHIDTGPSRWWGTRFPFGEDEAPAQVVQADPDRGTIAEFMDKFTPAKISHPTKRKRALA